MKFATFALASALAFAHQAFADTDAVDEVEFAGNGCAIANLAFSFLADEMGRDLEAMSTPEAREAFTG